MPVPAVGSGERYVRKTCECFDIHEPRIADLLAAVARRTM